MPTHSGRSRQGDVISFPKAGSRPVRQQKRLLEKPDQNGIRQVGRKCHGVAVVPESRHLLDRAPPAFAGTQVLQRSLSLLKPEIERKRDSVH